ncbi:hypothetical protein HDE79_003651 [Rhodanobacter sp. MP1X3]|nr:hypothetical protein [Rhodanobacter sp. MP1X3]
MTLHYAYPAGTHFPGNIVRTTDVYRCWAGWMTAHVQMHAHSA